jgi:tRNA (cmo5U34)-methyltransferase
VTEEWKWDPDAYFDLMVADVPGYLELQERAAAATQGARVKSILELGIGTGETTRRVLASQPAATLTAIDSSPEMLERARSEFPEADVRLSRLEDPLPEGPFDLVFSALAVHHLDGAAKRDLFRRVAQAVRPGGKFVLADVVVPEREEDSQIEIDWVMDLPDRLDDQLEWLREAGLEPEPVWTYKDLAVIRATKQAGG